MPEAETDIAFMDETLADAETYEIHEEREVETANTQETEARFDTPKSQEGTAAVQAILEERGGRPEDWAFVDRGDAGYRFDGENVRDPEGNIWTNPDAGLHQEMLEAWRAGEATVFLLPDYVERTEETETLYITTLTLDASGHVGWEIHAHETAIMRDEESSTFRETERSSETYAVQWEDIADELAFAEKEIEPALGMLATAEAESTTENAEEEIAEDDAWILRDVPSKQPANDTELGTILKTIFNGDPLDAPSAGIEQAIQRERSQQHVQEDGAPTVETNAPTRDQQLPLPETSAETILRSLGIPLPSPIQPHTALRTPLSGFRAPQKNQNVHIAKTRPGEAMRHGIRMRRAL